MKRFLYLVAFFAISFSTTAQSIDSIKITNPAIPPSFYLAGELFHTGMKLVRTEEIILGADSVDISIFFKECAGYQNITNYDTTIIFSSSFPAIPDYVRFTTFLDSNTNTSDSNCFQRAIPMVFDSTVVLPQASMSLQRGNLISQSIEFFPNPVRNYLTIEMDEAHSKLKIEIKDLTGKLVLSKQWKRIDAQSSKKINLKNLSSGEYILSIGDGQNFYETSKFTKE